MADPKYANLYGIAYDQPDVYETNDLPEAEQNREDIYEDTSDSIERIHISTKNALGKFRGKELDASNVDFSDSIKKKRKGTGYEANTTEWELAGDKEMETPAQKYHRLKLEAEELLQEVSELAEKNRGNGDDKAPAVSQYVDLLSGIQRIKIDALTGDQLTRRSVIGKANEEGDGGGGKFSSKYAFRMAELERRLNKLEGVIGTNSKQFTRLSSVNVDDGLLSSAEWMVAKLSALDPHQLDAIESRAASVNQRLEQVIATSKSANDQFDINNQLNELYEIANKCKEVSFLIPNIYQRMTALDSLHEKSKNSARIINELEATKDAISASISNTDGRLTDLEETMKSNLEAVKNSVRELQKRVEKS